MLLEGVLDLPNAIVIIFSFKPASDVLRGPSRNFELLPGGSQSWKSSDGLQVFSDAAQYRANERALFMQRRTPMLVAPNAELQAARQRVAGQIEEVARRRSLAADPASGRYRLAEEEAALRLEQQTGRQMRRDPSGAGDWLDSAGRTYDAVGTVPGGRFSLGLFTNQIDKHLLKQGLYYVVVDVSGLSAAERAAIMSHIGGLTPAQQARIIVQPR